jgi:hypothetical protein
MVQRGDVAYHTAAAAAEASVSTPQQRAAVATVVNVQEAIAPPYVPPPVVRAPSIVQQVARNVSEAIHELPDDLDVPTFLRHRVQKA